MSTKRAVLRIGFSLFAFSLAAACSLVVGTDPYKAGCPSIGKKPCETATGVFACVDLDDPSYGCARANCTTCNVPHAQPICAPDGQCAVGTCFNGFADCDTSMTAPGCEVDQTSDVHNCGVCGYDCEKKNVGALNFVSFRCGNGVCKVAQCKAGFLDCNGATSDGCEQAVDNMHCGPTCKACTGATPTCDASTGLCK